MSPDINGKPLNPTSLAHRHDTAVQSIFIEWNPDQLRLAIDAAGVALWSWNVDSNHFTMDQQGYDLWGLDFGAQITFDDLSAKIHPADRDRVGAAFAATRAIVGQYEVDFRILADDDRVRWVSARGKGDDADIHERRMFGIFLDVTGRKQAEEGSELLAGEMSHRVKNLLNIATALTAITFRSATSTEDMARELTGRLGALGRAHDLVRPIAGQTANDALLGDLLTILLAPYNDSEAFSGRIRVSVPRTTVGSGAATSLALVMHELATNSVKYGALSVKTGTLDVSCVMEDGKVAITWTEQGGPSIAAPTALDGFGSKLLHRSMAQLGGTVAHNWCQDGVVITLTMNAAKLTA